MTRTKQVENSMEVMEEQVDAYKKYAEIIGWLYTNDKAFDSVQGWRECFVEYLRATLLDELE